MFGDDVDGDEDGVYDVDDTFSCQKSREVQFRLVWIPFIWFPSQFQRWWSSSWWGAAAESWDKCLVIPSFVQEPLLSASIPPHISLFINITIILSSSSPLTGWSRRWARLKKLREKFLWMLLFCHWSVVTVVWFPRWLTEVVKHKLFERKLTHLQIFPSLFSDLLGWKC